ncbi:MAG TPA: magnesium/cobalt efflux protein, partial [Pseudoalteromonas sp.]|nr:magnesium/cobalt efflux protein [Pseudoalteromonas sp.]
PKTLSGLIVEYLEDIPDANLSLKIAGYPVEVLEVKENMIKQVKIKPNQRKL